MCTCCLCHLRENVFYLNAELFCLFFQQSICPGVALSKVLLAAQIPDRHEFTEFNSIARVSFASLVANVVKTLILFLSLKVDLERKVMMSETILCVS